MDFETVNVIIKNIIKLTDFLPLQDNDTSISNQLIDNIHYTVSVQNPAEHLFAVNMRISFTKEAFIKETFTKGTKETADHIIVALPAWIPGSYMIRDFAKNLHNLSAVVSGTDDAIGITQVDKQRWKVDLSASRKIRTIELSYHVYAYDLSVRSAYINDEYAFFNGTSVCLFVQGNENVPHYLSIDLSREANQEEVATLLPCAVTAMQPFDTDKAQTESQQHYCSDDYFELIDHPVIIGQFDDYCFDVLGHRFHLVFTGQHDIDFPQLEIDLAAIIEHHISLFGDFPCKEYWFMTLVCDKGFGGLEHIASTVLQYSRFDLPLLGQQNSDEKSASYRTFLSLCSHELFHTWHVKRIKPAVIHQPNLLEEVYTPQLWIYEGFTSFYDDLSLARSGVISSEQYADVLSETITRLLRNAGRHKQSVSSSSFEAWSKFYKQDAGSVNHIVSYYNKGAIVALCLDISLRQQSNDKISLDDIMRELWSQYGKLNIGTQNDVIENLCRERFNIDLSSFIYMATQNTMDLPLPTLLQHIGLSMKMRSQGSFDDKGGKSDTHFAFDVGANLVDDNGFIKVNSVFENRAASKAGLQVGDKIIAINRFQCDLKKMKHLLSNGKIGQSFYMHVLRDGRLIESDFEIFPAIHDTCEIIIETPELFNRWLGKA